MASIETAIKPAYAALERHPDIHAALAPRYLGLRAMIAKSFARIHWQNLVNFGVLPVTFAEPEDWERIEQGDELSLTDLHQTLSSSDDTLEIMNQTKDERYRLTHGLSQRQREIVLAGGLINVIREE